MSGAEEMTINRRLVRRASTLLYLASQGLYSDKKKALEATGELDTINALSGPAVQDMEQELTRMIRGY